MKNRTVLLLCILSFQLCGFGQSAEEKINKVDSKGLKQGYWVKKDDKGNVKYEGKFENDTPVGTFKYYYPENKKVSSLLEYTDKGKKANAKLYNREGKILGEGAYLNQKKDGLWKYYDQRGKLISEEFFSGNKKNGTWKVFYQNEKVASEKNWKDDLEEGSWNDFFENGTPKIQANFSAGLLDGKAVFYYPNGNKFSEGLYATSLKVGDWTNYNEDGSIKSKEMYQKGQLMHTQFVSGVFEEFYKDGIPKSMVTYKNGKKNGKFKEYYNTGKWVREIKNEGAANAELLEYIDGQIVKIEGMYKDDLFHGRITHYKEDGSLDKFENYSDGKEVIK